MKSITKAVFVLTIFSIISRLLGFVFKIYLSHSVGEQGMAIYQITISLFCVFLTLLTSGIPSILSREIAVHSARKDNKNIHASITSGLTIVSIFCLIIVVIMFALKPVFSFLKIHQQAINLLYLMIPAFVFSCYQNILKSYMWGKSDFFKMSLIDLIEQVCRISLCVLLSTQIFNVEVLTATAISLNIACAVSLAICIVQYVKNKGKLCFYKNNMKTLLKSSLPITTVRMVGSLVQPVTAIIVPFMLSLVGYTENQALSLYGATTGMVLPMLFLPSTFIGSLALALIPDLSSKMAVENKTAIVKQVKSAIVFTTIISIVLVPIFSGLGYEIGVVLFNSEMAGQLLEISAWIMLPLGLSNLSTSMLNAIGLEVKGFVNYLFGTIVLIICLFALPKFIGINSIIVGMGLCMAVSAMLNISLLSKKLNIKFQLFKTICILCLLSIPSYLIIVNCFGILKFVFPTIINIILCGGIGVLCYMILCVVFNIIKISQLKTDFLIKKTHKKHQI